MSEREAARDHYDAVVELALHDVLGPSVIALVKQTYKVTARGVERIAPEPLFHDMRDSKVTPLLQEGTDFWAVKLATDFVVQGSAFAPGGMPVRHMRVSIRAGAASKRILVHGRRVVVFRGRTPTIELIEPAIEVPMTWTNAYGGCDFRVRDPAAPPQTLMIAHDVDHPGLYPRNPFGKGYLVESAPVEGMELPQLEDPNDLLTPERLIVRDPRWWYRQPLPWGCDFIHTMMWPRTVFFADAIDAWFPGPEDENMPEVARGFLMSKYRTHMATRRSARPTDVWFHQEASHGLILRAVGEGMDVAISGMHPEGLPMSFRLPPAPRIELSHGHRSERVAANLHTICCRPESMTFYVLYGAALPIERVVVPGIHKDIRCAAVVDGDRPIFYECPEPLRDQLGKAQPTAR